MRTVPALGLGCVTVAALALSACSGSSSPTASTPPPSPTTSTSPTPTASSTTPVVAKPAVDPLTGGKLSHNPAVAAKIDDTINGRPQDNIDHANIVYIEQVEGGLTRLLAVFHTVLPTVEPVRSTRAADAEILSQYGPIGYVVSGGQHLPVSMVEKTAVKFDDDGQGGSGFDRDPNRSAPYNLQANLGQIAKSYKAHAPRSIGLSWSASIPNKQLSPGGIVQTVVGGTPVEFKWDTKTKRYDRVIDGVVQHAEDGRAVATPNVIVQFCKITEFAKDRDVLGNPNYFTHTVGHGKVAIFRNGKRIDGTWSRPKESAGTTFRDAHGKVIPLMRGGAWFVLVDSAASLHS